MSLSASTSLWMWRVKRSTWWTAAWPTTSPTPSSCGRSAASTSSSLLTFPRDPATPARPSRSLQPPPTRTAHQSHGSFTTLLTSVSYTRAQELLLAEKWARMNKLPFPKIDPKVFDREGLKECYVFKPGKGERNCPTVIHFVLVNINFRTFKAPGGYRREGTSASATMSSYLLPPGGARGVSSAQISQWGIQPVIWASPLNASPPLKKKKKKNVISDAYYSVGPAFYEPPWWMMVP